MILAAVNNVLGDRFWTRFQYTSNGSRYTNRNHCFFYDSKAVRGHKPAKVFCPSLTRRVTIKSTVAVFETVTVLELATKILEELFYGIL